MDWMQKNNIFCKKIGIIIGVYLGMKYLVPLGGRILSGGTESGKLFVEPVQRTEFSGENGKPSV